MLKLIEKPYLFFFFSIPIIMLVGILIGDAVLDINVHDTYFLITYLDFAVLLSVFFGIIGVGYWIMQKAGRKLSKWVNRIHVGLTFGGIILACVLTLFYKDEPMAYTFNDNLTLAITLLVLLVIIGQIVFPINIILGLIKKKSHH